MLDNTSIHSTVVATVFVALHKGIHLSYEHAQGTCTYEGGHNETKALPGALTQIHCACKNHIGLHCSTAEHPRNKGSCDYPEVFPEVI